MGLSEHISQLGRDFIAAKRSGDFGTQCEILRELASVHPQDFRNIRDYVQVLVIKGDHNGMVDFLTDILNLRLHDDRGIKFLIEKYTFELLQRKYRTEIGHVTNLTLTAKKALREGRYAEAVDIVLHLEKVAGILNYPWTKRELKGNPLSIAVMAFLHMGEIEKAVDLYRTLREISPNALTPEVREFLDQEIL